MFGWLSGFVCVVFVGLFGVIDFVLTLGRWSAWVVFDLFVLAVLCIYLLLFVFVGLCVSWFTFVCIGWMLPVWVDLIVD